MSSICCIYGLAGDVLKCTLFAYSSGLHVVISQDSILEQLHLVHDVGHSTKDFK